MRPTRRSRPPGGGIFGLSDTIFRDEGRIGGGFVTIYRDE